jgi:hypothetical protein
MPFIDDYDEPYITTEEDLYEVLYGSDSDDDE